MFPRAAQTAEAGHVRVTNACAFERCGQLFAAELRTVARLRNGADVNETLHAVRGQQVNERIDRTRRMSNGEDRHGSALRHLSIIALDQDGDRFWTE
jgi:hypothetical protein